MKLVKHPLENRSYFYSFDYGSKESNMDEWTQLVQWLDTNAPGWVLDTYTNILTLPKNLPEIETYFTIKFL